MTTANDTTDYSQGKLYRIVSPNHNKVYIGSTVETLAERFRKHKCKRDCMSREIIDAGDARIEEIELFPCLDKYQLEDREAELQLADWDGCVNKYVAGAIRRAGGKQAYRKVYREAHLDQIKAKDKVYREANAEKIKAKTAAYYAKNQSALREKHNIYAKNHRAEKSEYDKKYAAANAEKRKATSAVYREANAEKLKAKKNKQFTCSCGGKYTGANRGQHLRTKRHQKYVAAAKS